MRVRAGVWVWVWASGRGSSSAPSSEGAPHSPSCFLLRSSARWEAQWVAPQPQMASNWGRLTEHGLAHAPR